MILILKQMLQKNFLNVILHLYIEINLLLIKWFLIFSWIKFSWKLDLVNITGRVWYLAYIAAVVC